MDNQELWIAVTGMQRTIRNLEEQVAKLNSVSAERGRKFSRVLAFLKPQIEQEDKNRHAAYVKGVEQANKYLSQGTKFEVLSFEAWMTSQGKEVL